MTDILNLGFGRVAVNGEVAFNSLLPVTVAYVAPVADHFQRRTTDATSLTTELFYPYTVLEGVAKPSMGDLVVRVMAHKLDGSIAGSWHKGLTAKWSNLGEMTVVGAEYDIRAEQGSSGCAVSLQIIGAGIGVVLTGLAATTIDWVIKYEWLSLNDVTT